jgi:hypothetical protein
MVSSDFDHRSCFACSTYSRSAHQIGNRAAVTPAERRLVRPEVRAAKLRRIRSRLNLSYTHIVAPATEVEGDKTDQPVGLGGSPAVPGDYATTMKPRATIWEQPAKLLETLPASRTEYLYRSLFSEPYPYILMTDNSVIRHGGECGS